ncbi:MAG: TraR/DksA family transcriptional regulator [Muribaculaceae bacterium]|nr:TraR/DksA family transcriptional regulator [Muribaculaceae bacterium]
MNEENTEKVRYSDEELQEFKEIILKKLEEAEGNYRLEKDAMMADEANPTFKMMEEGSNTQGKETASLNAQRQMEFINKLRAALVRIENKTYGICRVTGKLIPKGRLLAVPHATTSIEGKEIEQQRKRQQ